MMDVGSDTLCGEGDTKSGLDCLPRGGIKLPYINELNVEHMKILCEYVMREWQH